MNRVDHDTICPARMDRRHYFLNVLDIHGRPTGTPVCESCHKRLVPQGAKWAVERYIIAEQEDIEDLIAKRDASPAGCPASTTVRSG